MALNTSRSLSSLFPLKIHNVGITEFLFWKVNLHISDKLYQLYLVFGALVVCFGYFCCLFFFLLPF